MDNTDLDVCLFFSKKKKRKKRRMFAYDMSLLFIRIGHNITKKLREKKNHICKCHLQEDRLGRYCCLVTVQIAPKLEKSENEKMWHYFCFSK